MTCIPLAVQQDLRAKMQTNLVVGLGRGSLTCAMGLIFGRSSGVKLASWGNTWCGGQGESETSAHIPVISAVVPSLLPIMHEAGRRLMMEIGLSVV